MTMLLGLPGTVGCFFSCLLFLLLWRIERVLPAAWLDGYEHTPGSRRTHWSGRSRSLGVCWRRAPGWWARRQLCGGRRKSSSAGLKFTGCLTNQAFLFMDLLKSSSQVLWPKWNLCSSLLQTFMDLKWIKPAKKKEEKKKKKRMRLKLWCEAAIMSHSPRVKVSVTNKTSRVAINEIWAIRSSLQRPIKLPPVPMRKLKAHMCSAKSKTGGKDAGPCARSSTGSLRSFPSCLCSLMLPLQLQDAP